MITDPRFAPKRKDLPWLRRRRLPKSATNPTPRPAPPPPAPPTPKPPAPAADPPLREFITGHATHNPEHETPAATSSSSLDLDAPTPPRPAPPAQAAPPVSSNSLDLDEPSAPTPAPSPPSPRPPSSSLDLDEPSAPTPQPPARSASVNSLGLDDPPPSRPAPTSAHAPQQRRRVDQRVRAGERVILTPTDPTVTLTALQSGIGSLTIEAATSAEVGDLRLGCAYEFDTGTSTPLEMTMQMTQGNRLAPPHSKRPVLLGSRDRFEKIAIDLRQCRSLHRLVVYAFSEARRPLDWGGTLIVTTFGGGRVEVPLESLQGGQIAVLMSIHQVRGELVLRAEMQALNGDVREAARAYGYDRITWLDDRTPVE